MTTVRRAKWHPPPQPTPRILQLPRRSRRRQHHAAGKSVSGRHVANGKLPSLVGKERELAYCGRNNNSNTPPVVLLNPGETIEGRRDTVLEVEDESSSIEEGDMAANVKEEDRRGKRPDSGWDGISAEKWRFQAEILRAECKFLRMEREIAVKRLERERAFLETTLKSAVHTLISVKRRIQEGQNVDQILDDEIEDLAKRLVEVQKCSRKTTRDINKKKSRMGHHHHAPATVSSISNFDEQAIMLHKQLNKLDGNSSSSCKDQKLTADGTTAMMTCRRRKMEGLSKGKLLKRMEEEYGGALLFSRSSANRSSIHNSAAFTSRRHEDYPLDVPCSSAASLQDSSQQLLLTNPCEQRLCSENCKAIVRRIMEQVRVETEQWSQMQEMLGQIREEMEELQASRDYWEDRALDAEYNIQSVQSSVQEWKEKAHALEIKDSLQQTQVDSLKKELDRLKTEKLRPDTVISKDLPPESLEAQLRKEKERWALTYNTNRAKGDNSLIKDKARDNPNNKGGKPSQKPGGGKITSCPSRFPFKDIGNMSSPTPLMRQNSRRYVYPLQSPQYTDIT